MPVKKLITQLPPRSYTSLVSANANVRMGDMMKRLSQHFGDNLPAPLKDEELAIPDTPIATASLQLSQSLNRPSMFGHSMRTYLFGLCIGKHLNELAHIDREQFFIACALHMIGFSDELRTLPRFQGRDFELIGAEYARDFLVNAERGYPSRLADGVHEAIALHTSLGVVEHREPQLSLLHQGASLDVIGSYKYHIRREVIDAVLERYPRITKTENFAVELRELCRREMEEKPRSSTAYDMCLGLDALILVNPLDKDRESGYPPYS